MNHMLSTEGFGSTRGAEASTWSQMIKDIEVSKKTLPWSNGDFVPSIRVPLPERKANERALDPITMKLRDPMTQDAFNAKKMDRTQTKVLERLKDIRATEFNIINHTGPPRNYEKVLALNKDKTLEPERAFNLFSHLRHDKQTTCPILWDQSYMNTHMPPRKGPIEGQKPGREFNLISNQFSENHDQMLKADYDKMKKDMVKKYWETHDYNPITAEYFADDKEIEVAAKEKQKRSTHGQNNDLKLPPGYRFSEGNSYDILTLEVKDEDKVVRALSKKIKEENRLSKFKGFPQKQVAAGVAAYDKAQKQHIARVGYERWSNEINRGYDFVGTGPNIAATYKPLPVPKRTVWEKVQDAKFHENYNANSTAVLMKNESLGSGSSCGVGGTPSASAAASVRATSPITNSNHNNGNNGNGNGNGDHVDIDSPYLPSSSRYPFQGHTPGRQVTGTGNGNGYSNYSARYSARDGESYSARSETSANALTSARAAVSKSKVVMPPLDLTRTASGRVAVPILSVRTGGLSAY